MKVFVYFKIKNPDNLTSKASRIGDLIYIYPIVNSRGKKHHQGNLTLDSFRPISIDLTIPCGNDFLNLKQICQGCQWNNPLTCDYRKFQRAVWSTGTVLKKPKIIFKSRFKLSTVKMKALFGDLIEKNIDKMTATYKSIQYRRAETGTTIKSILIDKSEL